MNGLVVTADDFGMAREINDAVEIAHTKGILSAASLMTAGSFARDAVDLAKRLPSLSVGLHLALTNAAPTLPAEDIPSLVGGDGRLRSDLVRFAVELAASGRARRQMRAEIEAQFLAFASTGLRLDHVSVHQHFHLHPVVAAVVLDVAAKFGKPPLRVPFEPARLLPREKEAGARVEDLWSRVLARAARRRGMRSADGVFGLRWSGAMTRERVSRLLQTLPDGVWEIYTHPATRNVFPGHAPGYRYVDELQALVDPRSTALLAQFQRRVGGYADTAA